MTGRGNSRLSNTMAGSARSESISAVPAGGQGGPEQQHPPPKRRFKPKPDHVDVDLQCGVQLPAGGVCARSLTCKSHSMGAKRAVPGRSQPYDQLLAAYQQRNKVKQAHKSALALQKQDEQAAAAAALTHGPPLSDREEAEQVWQAARQSYAEPVAPPRVVLAARSRRRFVALREMLLGSLATVPPLPQVNPQGANVKPITAVMASTGLILGRCSVYSPNTNARTTRPARAIPKQHVQSVPRKPEAAGAHEV